MQASKPYIAVLFFTFCASFLITGCSKEGNVRNDAKALVSAGRKHLSEENVEDAIRDFNAAIAREPNNFEANYELGAAYYKARNFKEAERALESALELKPDEPKAHNMLGLIYEREGSFESAKKSFQE